jgi:hypothetical protein
MPSNLPPGVTDAMIDAQFGERPDLHLNEVREWYLAQESCEVNLADFLLDRLFRRIHNLDDPGQEWFDAMLDAFWKEWGGAAEEEYIEHLEDNREDY